MCRSAAPYPDSQCGGDGPVSAHRASSSHTDPVSTASARCVSRDSERRRRALGLAETPEQQRRRYAADSEPQRAACRAWYAANREQVTAWRPRLLRGQQGPDPGPPPRPAEAGTRTVRRSRSPRPDQRPQDGQRARRARQSSREPPYPGRSFRSARRKLSPHPSGERPRQAQAGQPPQNRSSKPQGTHDFPVSGSTLNPGGQ